MSFTDTFATPDDLGDLHASELHTSLAEQLGAEAGEAFMGGVRNYVLKPAEYSAARGEVPDFGAPVPAELYDQFNPADKSLDMPMADAAAQVKQEKLDIALPDQPTIRKPVFDLMVQDARERRQYAAAVNRGPQGFKPGALGFLTQIGAGIIDPVYAAAFSIPVLGEARFGMLMARAGESVAARAALRTGVGAAQGGLGGAALVPADWWLHTQDGQDYTFADALKSVVLSAGTGAAAHGGLGLLGDIGARALGRPLRGSIEDLRARALAGDTRAAEIVEKLGGAGVHLPAAALEPGGVETDAVPGITGPAAARPAASVEAQNVSGADVLANPDQPVIPPHPAEVLADLPPSARENVLQATIADITAGRPARAAEMLTEAAKEDPRIAESMNGAPRAAEASAPELGAIDNSHDVVSGANSAKNPNGPVYVDRRIPEFSPTLKDRDGNPANLHKYLAIHERTEADAEARGLSYDKAHTDVATPAERAAVEADGVSWKGYTDEIDGYLSKIEHEKAANPPTEPLHVDPEAAIGHHRASNKNAPAEAEPKSILRKTGGRGPRARDPQTWSLLEFLAHKGGIDPGDANIGDVHALTGGKRKFIPGFGDLVRKGGMKLDRAREAAVEAGYLHDSGVASGGESKSTVNDLLDAMDGELRGKRVYRYDRVPEHAQRAEAERTLEINRAHAETELDATLKEIGEDPAKMPDARRERVLEIMTREGESDPLIALEREALEAYHAEAETGQHEPLPGQIPGWNDDAVGGRASDTGGAGAGRDLAAQGADRAGARGGGAADRSPQSLAQRADWLKLRDVKPSEDDNDLAAASRAADKAPEVASTEPAKAVSAAQAAAGEADKLLADLLPKLTEAERKTFEETLSQLSDDQKAREQIVRDGAACLAEAAA